MPLTKFVSVPLSPDARYAAIDAAFVSVISCVILSLIPLTAISTVIVAFSVVGSSSDSALLVMVRTPFCSVALAFSTSPGALISVPPLSFVPQYALTV